VDAGGTGVDAGGTGVSLDCIDNADKMDISYFCIVT